MNALTKETMEKVEIYLRENEEAYSIEWAGDYCRTFDENGDVIANNGIFNGEINAKSGSFGKGAVEAARFLAGKPAGRYDMSDVIQF